LPELSFAFDLGHQIPVLGHVVASLDYGPNWLSNEGNASGTRGYLGTLIGRVPPSEGYFAWCKEQG
jgi:hypothetical protein